MEITIRRAEVSDVDALHAIFSQPRVIWGTLHLPHISRALWHERLANPTTGVTHLVACVDEVPVGQGHLQTFDSRPRRKHVGSIGMAVHDDWQGKGIGTALMAALLDMADNWFNLLRVELDVFSDNEPAIRLYKKFGFIAEGTARKYAFRDGEYADVLRMARLKTDSGW